MDLLLGGEVSFKRDPSSPLPIYTLYSTHYIYHPILVLHFCDESFLNQDYIPCFSVYFKIFTLLQIYEIPDRNLQTRLTTFTLYPVLPGNVGSFFQHSLRDRQAEVLQLSLDVITGRALTLLSPA